MYVYRSWKQKVGLKEREGPKESVNRQGNDPRDKKGSGD